MPAIKTKSMTAFARVEAHGDFGDAVWEIRSINHRYLEPSFKLPESFRALEFPLREKLKKAMARGKLEISLRFKAAECGNDVDVHLEKVSALLDAADQISAHAREKHGVDDTGSLKVTQLLNWPGVLAEKEINMDEVGSFLLSKFDDCVVQLIESRGSEGLRLGEMVEERLVAIEEIVQQTVEIIPAIREAQATKLKEKLDELAVDVDPDRLAQEAVIIANKSDVAEELDRLKAHVSEVRETMAKNQPCGRRLDFLMQEFNREANTLGSKSMSVDTTNYAIELKVLIEQMREQIQNIE